MKDIIYLLRIFDRKNEVKKLPQDIIIPRQPDYDNISLYSVIFIYFSTIMAVPMPPPMQRVARPYLDPRLSIS